MNICPDCDYTNVSINSVSTHFRKRHNKSSKDLYVALFCCGTEPQCACGCASPVKYLGINNGFSKYVLGHASRVNNNWGHNIIAKAKSEASRARSFANGEWKAWNKGLTVDDDRVKRYGRSGSKTIMDDCSERKSRSRRMSKNRLSGTVPSLIGVNHPQWNGGTSHLATHCHGHSKLYVEWKFPKLKAANFTCQKCGASHPLHVHHDQERMATIIKRFSAQFGYDGTEKTQNLKHEIAQAVADYHIQNDVSAVVLCVHCHIQAHEADSYHI